AAVHTCERAARRSEILHRVRVPAGSNVALATVVEVVIRVDPVVTNVAAVVNTEEQLARCSNLVAVGDPPVRSATGLAAGIAGAPAARLGPVLVARLAAADVRLAHVSAGRQERQRARALDRLLHGRQAVSPDVPRSIGRPR